MKKHLKGFEPIGERLCKIRFKGRFRNITMLSGHAPTEENDEQRKKNFMASYLKHVIKYQSMICSFSW
jgi:hypothetical protein